MTTITPPALPSRDGAAAAAAATSPTTSETDLASWGEAERLLLVHNARVLSFPATQAETAAPAQAIHGRVGELRAQGLLEVFNVMLDAVASATTSAQVHAKHVELTMLTVPAQHQGAEPFQLPLLQSIAVVREGPASFLVPLPAANCIFRIEVATPDTDELDALVDLLTHYTALDEPSTKFRNTVALVGPTGQVVGTLAEGVDLDAHSVTAGAKGPVLLTRTVTSTNVPGEADKVQWTVAEAPKEEVDRAAAVGGAVAYPDASIEEKIFRGSVLVGDLLIQGAGLLSQGIVRGSENIKDSVRPNEKPLEFTPQTRGQLETAKKVSSAAVQATGALVAGAVTVASTVGSAVAAKMGGDGAGGFPADSKRARTLKVTSTIIKSLAVLGDRASTSGRMVLKATGQGAATIIERKYGAEAGAVARDVALIGDNAFVVYFDSKGLRRVVLMSGAKTAVHELSEKTKALDVNGNPVPASAAAGPVFTTSSATTTTGAAPPANAADFAASAMAFAQDKGPKVAAAVQEHAPKVAAAVAEHGPKVAAAVASGAWSLWTAVSAQMAASSAASAAHAQSGAAPAGAAASPAAAATSPTAKAP
ncbi:hypothetical protein H9P43_004150 [Blastocladiella emersonii ATCC 22665]|nr:hypothetical protein H9P43_004150 [Blastocladiella emersonii ATCC 22665]